MKQLLFILLLLPVFAKAQIITTVAGTGVGSFSGDGGSATVAELNGPNYVTCDRLGNIFIVDAYSNRIRKVNTSGVISTIAGTGVAGFSGDGGPAILAEIRPYSIAIDTFGNIYFGDGHRIRKINTSGIVSTIAGTGVFGYNGDGIPAITAQLHYPYMGAIDNAGNVYFSDYNNHRIRKIDPAGIITTIAGNGMSGYSGDGGPATAAQIMTPCALFQSPSGDIYIPDNSDNRIRKVTAAGIITTIAGTGMLSDAGDGGPATAASVTSPNTVTMDNIGNIYVASNGSNIIRKIDVAGSMSTFAGDGIAGFAGDGGPASTARFNGLNFITLDGDGNLLIADLYNNRVRKIIFPTVKPADTTTVVISPGTLDTSSNLVRTSISSQSAIETIALYPNPVTNELTVTGSYNIASISIINLIGQVVHNQDYNAKKVQVNVSNLPKGIYIIKINDTDTRKFMKE